MVGVIISSRLMEMGAHELGPFHPRVGRCLLTSVDR